ncbi:hypothetical protein BJP25_10875 [Actinokineospora bangkokensis]|uniref:Uncharacterized protein n=1 Tax=Actinokineospora bangkokensis TaxID=1193682 RepID=A0A1Q9LRU5_9PSEU|nr:hypothetical protein BJP25_10875 [Actinokineospora bangkokensis]
MRKFAVVAVSALSLLACCGLAYWQWQRFESANGTFQNLGYVLQWPLFGIAPAYMFWRLRKLRAQQPAAPPAPPPPPPPPPPARPRAAAQPHEDDDELAAYNRYLAGLNAQEPR